MVWFVTSSVFTVSAHGYQISTFFFPAKTCLFASFLFLYCIPVICLPRCGLCFCTWICSQCIAVTAVGLHKKLSFAAGKPKRSNIICAFVHTEGLTPGQGRAQQTGLHLAAVTPLEITGHCCMCLYVADTPQLL